MSKDLPLLCLNQATLVSVRLSCPLPDYDMNASWMASWMLKRVIESLADV